MGRKHIIVLIVLLVTTFAVGYVIGQSAHKGVCHSKTEDSPITDCNYQNGTWTPK